MTIVKRTKGRSLVSVVVATVVALVVGLVPAAALATPPSNDNFANAEASANSQVGRYGLEIVGAEFSYVEEGEEVLFQVSAGRDTVQPSGEGAAQVTTRALLGFQRYNPETGEAYSWTCDMPVDDSTLAFSGEWSAEVHALLTCSDGVADSFPASVDLTVKTSGPVVNDHIGWAHVDFTARFGDGHATITAQGITYNLASQPGGANIGRYSAVDPFRTDRVFLDGESSGFFHENVEGLECIGVSDLFATGETVRTLVLANVTLDGSGTYHLRASGTIGYTIVGGDGVRYRGTAAVRISEVVDLVLDENGSGSIPIEIPITLTGEDGSSAAAFVIDGTIGVSDGNHTAFVLSGSRCA